MSKWWARRPSSVFRSTILAAATKAPDDPSHAARLVWENYYANHQTRGAFKHLKVSDIFMGGGTTLVEGSRLGMQMSGNDLNPVAWFVVKQELAQVDLDEVQRLLAEIEAVVRPQIIPFYYCDGPNGEKGTWTHLPSGRVEGADFDPLSLTPEQRADYRYEGPETIYTFWAKHGPCQMTGCGHRTPIMSNPVMAVKSLTVKSWSHCCQECDGAFDIEEKEARMAPDAPLYVSPEEPLYCILDKAKGATCPHCGHIALVNLGKGKNKKVELSLLVHPEWLAGSPGKDEEGRPFGGSAQDDAESTAAWNQERASHIRLLEVRGKLPEQVTCPETGVTFPTGAGTVPKKSHYTCASCGRVQDVLTTVKATGKTGPAAGYAIQGYAPARASNGEIYGGRFFAPLGSEQARQLDAALAEWHKRREGDLQSYWPTSEIPYGFMTAVANSDIRENYGFTHWWTMFNPRQLLVHTQLLKAISTVGDFVWEVREFVLGAFQQFLRFNCMFTVYHRANDQATKHFANNNFHPRNTLLEVAVFAPIGDGRWTSAGEALISGAQWKQRPWDLIPAAQLVGSGIRTGGKSEKVFTGDSPLEDIVELSCSSSSDLEQIGSESVDLVITDPPFGGLIHYSELADFFYVWLRLLLKERYPNNFAAPYTPKSLEAVTNSAREPDDPEAFYQRLLTQCWREAYRILKPGGLLAFTFHHSEDEPWVSVLESLFESGYYLEATYPIRSDTAMDSGQFGSKTIEYDIIHVCRKRMEEPKPVSWAKLRRAVMADVKQVQGLLENHTKSGLPAADVQVIRRGKALEYFSRHYGKVYVDQDRPMTVQEALLGINQLLEEDAERGTEPPPVSCEPLTRQFLRIFGRSPEVPRDQLQKFLRGTITTPDEFVQRGWCTEKKKVFYRTSPLEMAQDWKSKPNRRLLTDLDKVLVLVGACFSGSGIKAEEVLERENFSPPGAIKALLEWVHKQDPDRTIQQAASRALIIYQNWLTANFAGRKQLEMFEGDEE